MVDIKISRLRFRNSNPRHACRTTYHETKSFRQNSQSFLNNKQIANPTNLISVMQSIDQLVEFTSG